LLEVYLHKSTHK